ncbi:two-component sensor histidine kinase [Streptococcus iniae]|uniref:two-component system histidine kinase PnpS n=1 Tax=Streptococcus iniae TaxID=1346 RepID=UPI000EF7B9B3|nr:ATP-binding protein [Streptococcus iniae]RLU44604.1 two-component sensor histidine kinase [Streptococcus iniae]RMI48724.1 two-component sensor histidine kinase [Streptococcus iniae]
MLQNLKQLTALMVLLMMSLGACLFFAQNQWLLVMIGGILLALMSIPLRRLFAWEKQFQVIQAFHFSGSPTFLPDDQGDLRALLQQLSQMTKQLKEEKAKGHQLSDNLEALLSHLTMGILLVDANKEILLQSASLPHFFPGGQAPFKEFSDISRMDIKALITEVFDCKESRKKELKGFHDDDLILEVTAVPILNLGNSLDQVLVLIYDLTTIRTYEKLNLDFVTNASHELRTPVTSIKGFAETVKGMPEDESDLKNEFLDIIYNESLRLEHIVEHMLTLSKVKKTQLQESSFSLNTFLHYMANSIKPQIEAKQLHLFFDLSEDITLKTDKYLLSQMVLNLLTNAVRYTDEGGSITISSQCLQKSIALSISDTGIGISQLEIDRIFERFYRVNKGRSRQSGGTGLGLSIVKELSQLLGGQVSVKSQLGRGSQFTLEFPKELIEI